MTTKFEPAPILKVIELNGNSIELNCAE